jgi:uncharacterized protein (TIGR03435 family)
MKIAFVLAVTVVTAASQSLSFDVVSVRRGASVDAVRGISVMPGGRLTAPSVTVRDLVAAAYGLQDNQIVDGPEWTGHDRFEVAATTRPDVSSADARAMLRTLLADRFRFAAHQDTRELPVYVMTMAREDRTHGPLLRAAGPECAPMKGPMRGVAAPSFVAAPPPPPPPPPPGARPMLFLGSEPIRCPSMAARMNGGGHWSLRDFTMARIAGQLTAELGRPVTDRTGLTGTYDLDLTFASDAAVIAVQGPTEAPPLMTALRDQLGLRLDSSRARVQVLVIDRVEQPTEN